MVGDAETPRVVRAPRRKEAKPPRRAPAARSKRSLVLSDDAWLRLTVHAQAARVDRSDLVESLINDHCRRYVVQDRGARPELPTPVGCGPVRPGESAA